MKKSNRNALIATSCVAVPAAFLAGVAIFKPFNIDPIGAIENQLQPSCEVSAPGRRIDLSLILAGLMNHDDDLLGDNIQIKGSDDTVYTVDLDAAMSWAGGPFDVLQPNESVIVPHISEAACTEVNRLVQQLDQPS